MLSRKGCGRAGAPFFLGRRGLILLYAAIEEIGGLNLPRGWGAASPHLANALAKFRPRGIDFAPLSLRGFCHTPRETAANDHSA